jgi:choice-of-anchor B domain-containing protein
VSVEQIPAALSLGFLPQQITVIGEITPLNASAVDARGNSITNASVAWESSDAAIARVVGATVIALSPGTVEITALVGSLTATTGLEVFLSGRAGPAIYGGEVPCDAGFAGSFPCSGVTVLAYLPVGGLGAAEGMRVTDLWGWTDPSTGVEYAILERLDGTTFVDLSDPVSPVLVGHLPQSAGSSPSVWRDVKVHRNHAFIVADGAGAHGMQVFDLTRLRDFDGLPMALQETAHYDEFASAHNIAIDQESELAFVVGANSGGSTCAGGFHVVDISSPTSPTFAGCFAATGLGRRGSGYVHDAQCLVYRGPDVDYTTRPVCFAANENAISIVDVGDGTNAQLISSVSYPDVQYAHQGWLSEDQRFFFSNDELDEVFGSSPLTRTLIWDVADLDDPILVGTHLGPTSATDHNMYVVGDRLFSSNYQNGLRVMDISDPAAPFDLAFIDTAPGEANVPGFDGSWSNYPFFESGIVAITSGFEGLIVVRVD